MCFMIFEKVMVDATHNGLSKLEITHSQEYNVLGSFQKLKEERTNFVSLFQADKQVAMCFQFPANLFKLQV